MESMVGKTLIITSILYGISEGLSNGKHLPSLVREKRLDPFDEEPSTNEPVDINTLKSDESNYNTIEKKYKRTNIERRQNIEKTDTSTQTETEITGDSLKNSKNLDHSDGELINIDNSKTRNIQEKQRNEEKTETNSKRTNEKIHDEKEKSKHSKDSKSKETNNKFLRTNVQNDQTNAENSKPSLKHSENSSTYTETINDSHITKNKVINHKFQTKKIELTEASAVKGKPSSQPSEDIAKHKEENEDTDKNDSMEIISTKLHSEEEKFIDNLKSLPKTHHKFHGKSDQGISSGETIGVESQRRSTTPPSVPTEDLRRQFRRHLKRKIRHRLRKSKLIKQAIPVTENQGDISPISLSDLKEAVKSSTTQVNENTPQTETKLEKHILASARIKRHKTSFDISTDTRAHKSITKTRTRLGRKTDSPNAKVNKHSSLTPDLAKVRPLTIRVSEGTQKKTVSEQKETESEDTEDNVPVTSAELKKAIELSATRENEDFGKNNSVIVSSRTPKLKNTFPPILGMNAKTPLLISLPKLSKSQSSPTGWSYIPLKGNKNAEQFIKPSLKRRKRLSRHKKSNDNLLNSSMKLSSTLRFTFSTPFDRQVRSRSSVSKPTESMVKNTPSVQPLVAPKVTPSRTSLPDFFPSLKKIPSEDLMMLNDFFNHAATFKEKQMRAGSSPTKRQANAVRVDGLRQEQFKEKPLEKYSSDYLEGKHDKQEATNDYLYRVNQVKDIHGHQVQEDNDHKPIDNNFQNDNYHGHQLNENRNSHLNDNLVEQSISSQGNRIENHDSFFEKKIKSPSNLIHQSKNNHNSFFEESSNPHNLVHRSRNSGDSHVHVPRNNTEENESKTPEFKHVQGHNKVERKLGSEVYAKELLEFQRKAIEAEEKRLDDEMRGKEHENQGDFNFNKTRQHLQEPIAHNNAKQHGGYRMAQGLEAEIKGKQDHQSDSNQIGPNPSKVNSQNQAKEHKVHELLEQMGRRWKESQQAKALNRVSSPKRKVNNSQETTDRDGHEEGPLKFDLFEALKQITKHSQNVSSERHSSRWNVEKLNNHSVEHNGDDSNYLTRESDGDQHWSTNDHDKQNYQNKHNGNVYNNNVNTEEDADITKTRKQGMNRHRRKMLPSQGPKNAAEVPTKGLPKDSDDEVVEMAFTPFIPTTATPLGNNNNDDKSVEVEIGENGKLLTDTASDPSPVTNKIQDTSKTTNNTIQRSYGDLTGQPQGTKAKDANKNGDLVIYDSDDNDADAQDVETVESEEKQSDGNNVKINTTVQRSGDKKVHNMTTGYNIYGLNPNSEDDTQDDRESYNNDKDRNNDIEIAIGQSNNKLGQAIEAGINGGHDTSSNLNNNNDNDNSSNNNNNNNNNEEEGIPHDNRLLYILGDPEQITKKEQSRQKIEEMVDKVHLNTNQTQNKPQQAILNRELRARLKAMEIRVLEAHQKVSQDLEEIERHLTDKYETLKRSISQAKTLTRNVDNKINDTVLHVLKLAKTSADAAKNKVRLVLKAATALTDIEKHMGANETRNIARVIKSRIAELPASKYRAYQRILAMNNMITKMDGAKVIAESKANSSFTSRNQVEENMADIATNVLEELTSTEDELNKDTEVEIEDEKEAERKLEDAERRNYMVAIKSGEALKKIEGYLERLENEETKLHNTKN